MAAFTFFGHPSAVRGHPFVVVLLLVLLMLQFSIVWVW